MPLSGFGNMNRIASGLLLLGFAGSSIAASVVTLECNNLKSISSTIKGIKDESVVKVLKIDLDGRTMNGEAVAVSATHIRWEHPQFGGAGSIDRATLEYSYHSNVISEIGKCVVVPTVAPKF